MKRASFFSSSPHKGRPSLHQLLKTQLLKMQHKMYRREIDRLKRKYELATDHERKAFEEKTVVLAEKIVELYRKNKGLLWDEESCYPDPESENFPRIVKTLYVRHLKRFGRKQTGCIDLDTVLI